MSNTIRVEMPIIQNSIVISKYKTIGGLKEVYKNLFIVKYIYLDPQDNKLKGINPPNEIPLVNDAYITVMGNFKDIIELSKELVNSDK